MSKKVLIVGSGLAGLASALRLASKGYDVKILEKNSRAGGRLNRLEVDGFRFDTGPTFFSMSYVLKEFEKDTGVQLDVELFPLDPLYTVRFRNEKAVYKLYKDPQKMIESIGHLEPDFEKKYIKYLEDTGELFHDTFDVIVKRNFNSFLAYAIGLLRVPPKHLPKLRRSFWEEVDRRFESKEIKQIFSLVSFFLGGTPFDTPALYSILSYSEFKHDGYFGIKGGMYALVEAIEKELRKLNVEIVYNSEIVDYQANGSRNLHGFVDQNGKAWEADLMIVNSDAAAFRGQVFKRSGFSEEKLVKKQWTMAPFTIYVGIEGEVPGLEKHNYFLGQDFRDYADTVFTSAFNGEQPYYYVNVPSMSDPTAAPEGHQALFFLCPVPDLRFKNDWTDEEQFADRIIDDFVKQTGYDIRPHIKTRTIYSPEEWERQFNLFRGSGLGLGHKISQMAWMRPANRDEKFRNVFYTGASTIPGTGLPMTLISSALTVEQIDKRYGSLS
ncbi:phytoene desaturase family protein [Saccharicrinis sp. FJH62]|uniref:phytoene desaturase family protein n=1 Tax=Saccharicrinis sp. FJH62 TaxID=3344657 RepID=UPI0035D40505